MKENFKTLPKSPGIKWYHQPFQYCQLGGGGWCGRHNLRAVSSGGLTKNSSAGYNLSESSEECSQEVRQTGQHLTRYERELREPLVWRQGPRL